PAEEQALRAILAGAVPVVVDAGALDLVEAAAAEGTRAPLVVTPHAGEFARLRERLVIGGHDIATASDERAVRARSCVELARRIGAVVLLKGAQTLVADPSGQVLGVASRTSWLATAGTGDVLAGILGALIAANPDAPLHQVAAAGAWLHAEAAARAAGVTERSPGHPIVALDVAEALPGVVGDLLA